MSGGAMNGDQLATLLDGALRQLATCRDELRDLDAALGDGDLGITVAKGCEGVRAKLGELPSARPAVVLRAAGAAFASANPSTMAALVGGGVLAAAKALGTTDTLDRSAALAAGRAAADSIARRGKAQPGDKTILDALLPSLDALAAATSQDAGTALEAMVAAAAGGVRDTTPLQSQRGRAAWLGERSVGQPDPGATAYLRLLEALRTVWPDGAQAQPIAVDPIDATTER
jgi:phosphoenolpyruvate---glycerone phosphotransferase subunit DhaL